MSLPAASPCLRPLRRITAAAALLVLAPLAQALNFETIALSGTTALPFATGPALSYSFDLRQPTIADDGWVGFSAGQPGGVASQFLIGQPGEVLHVLSAGESVGGTALNTLRAMRVDSGRGVAVTASPAGSITLHFTADDVAVAPLVRLAATGLVYNKTSPSAPIAFELLSGGQQLVHAIQTTSNPSYEAGRLAEDGSYTALVRSNSAALRALPTTGVPGVGTPAAGRLWGGGVQAVGGDASGRSFLFGLQTGSGLEPLRSNLVEVRPDGGQVSVLHPGSTVPGAGRPSLGINPAVAQFASGAGGTLALRSDLGRNTTQDRTLRGAILRYDSAPDLADSRLSVAAMPGQEVPGLRVAGQPVSFGHKIGVDSGSSLAELSMLPDNLGLDAARGLAVNDGGTIAFVSAITAAPAAAGYGVFLSQRDGSFATLATSGAVGGGIAPGTEASWLKFHDVTVNNSGMVVFSGTLVGADGRRGLWYGHDASDLQLLALEGQTLELLPGVSKTVGRLDTGLHELSDTRITALDDGLNNAGQFAFSVSFTDGTQAVLRTPLVASVPEPGEWALLLGGLAALGLRRRQRAG